MSQHDPDVPDLDVIVPVWNEEQRIGRTLEAVTAHAATTGLRVVVTVVDNGSVDRTAEVVDRVDAATPERVRVRLLGCSRQGKGAAVRRGVLASRARWVGFCDADLATPPEALDDVLVRLSAGDPVVIGSRRCAGARVEVGQPPTRRLGSLGFRVLTQPITHVADSQCGFKFFTAAAAREIFSRSTVDGFTFDVELLGLAHRLGHRVTEVPVDWSDQAGSSLSLTADGPTILAELLAVRRALAAAVPVVAIGQRSRAAGRTTVVVNWRDAAHPQAGGAELYCERVAHELGAAGGDGGDVVYLTSRPRGTARREDRGTYRVVRGGGTYGVYPFVLAWLAAHRRSVGAVLDSQNGIPFFTPLALGRRTPALLLVHHVHQEQFGARFGPLVARVGRFLEGPASRTVYGRRLVVAVSPSTRAGVRRRLHLRGAISVLPCGMDAPAASGAARSGTPRVVVVGRLVTHKRLHLLVAAMATVRERLPRAELHMVGDGPARAQLQTLAASATSTGLTTFHGRLPDGERDALLASAWLTVNPSPGEGWGLSVIEANAAGVPALAYRVSGLQDSILPGRTGWLVGPGEDLGVAVADALDELADPDVARRYAAAAREWAGHFSWEATAQGVALAVAIERDRLRAGRRDRRAGNDLVCLVEVPRRLLAPGWERHQRQGDTWTVHRGPDAGGGPGDRGGPGGSVRGLLRGADESDVSAALARLGVDRRDPDVRVVVARPADLLGSPAPWADDRAGAIEPAAGAGAEPDGRDVESAASGAGPA